MAAVAYADHKRRHLDTAAACESQHVLFLPMVVETTGAWAPEAEKALGQIARGIGMGSMADPASSTLLQQACVLVRTWRARAALRRRAEMAA